jgi:hypothetical protein
MTSADLTRLNFLSAGKMDRCGRRTIHHRRKHQALGACIAHTRPLGIAEAFGYKTLMNDDATRGQ